MGKLVTKIPNLCLIVIRPRARVRPPSIQSRNQEKYYLNEENKQGDKSGPSITGRKIMIFADSTVEGKNAVHWALTHTVQNQDKVIFLHVTKQGGQSTSKDLEVKVPEFITSMKNSWQIKKPEVHIEVMVVEGKEKGAAVVAAAEKEGAALLVVGKKKRWLNRVGDGVAEYCVQNATCMAIAVRQKSKKLGGYVITTKRHKDFWLLA